MRACFCRGGRYIDHLDTANERKTKGGHTMKVIIVGGVAGIATFAELAKHSGATLFI